MSSIILYTIITLSLTGIVSAVILYIVSQKFKVEENPKIDEVLSVLPNVNCGGCGYPGCRSFAEACANAAELEKLYCPVGGSECMKNVAKVLGKEVVEREPMIAVVRCNGTIEARQQTNIYDSAESCVIVNGLFRGETGCEYGCLRLGDCVKSCKFAAMYMDEKKGLPVVIEDKCVACGACVKACPRHIIELRKKGPKGRRVFVSCNNKEKGSVASLHCKVACIACQKCKNICPFAAITVENNLAYIDFNKCKLCRKCVSVCPTGAIHETNFSPKKQEESTVVKEAA